MADESTLSRNIRRTQRELSKLTEIIGESNDSNKRYHGILEALGEVFIQLYAPSVRVETLKSAADELLTKAMRLNDTGDNLDVKEICVGFATRTAKLTSSEAKVFVTALNKVKISEFLSLISPVLTIPLGEDPNSDERKRKEAEEAERKRREAEEAERKRREAEEEERKRREAEEEERKRREAEEAERKRRKSRLRKRGWITFLLILLTGIALWWFWEKNFFTNDADDYSYVYVEKLTLRSSPISGNADNALDLLPYGTPVKILETHDEEWVKVKSAEKTGYVASYYLLDSKRFQLLDSIWDENEPDVRQLVPTAYYRRAILDFLERDSLNPDRNNWRLYNQPNRGYNNVSYPNLLNGYDKVQDFAFILKNKYLGRREVILYSISNDLEPVFIHQEQAYDFPPLKRVTYNNRKNHYNFEYVLENTKPNNSPLLPDELSTVSKTMTKDSMKEKHYEREKKKTDEKKYSPNIENDKNRESYNDGRSNSKSEHNSTSHREQTNDNTVITESNACFPGGEVEMYKWIQKNIRYPETALKNHIQGRVLVKFIVEKDGSVLQPQTLRSIDKDLDKEAIRVISKMPKWNPATKGGEPVTSFYVVPITFKLN